MKDHSHEKGTHHHSHEHGHHHDNTCNDYATAVGEYRKTFPSKADVMAQAPDPAVRDMIAYMDRIGCENCFDRADQQKPQCTFGLAGICCKNCTLGPCKITKKAPRGICGAGADLIVARNLCRSAAAGASAHSARSREVMLALKKAAAGEIDIPILGKDKVLAVSKMFGLETEGATIESLAGQIADILLEDMGRAVPGEHRTLKAAASPERYKVWKDLGLLPLSAYHEIFEAMHQTVTGNQGDWRKAMDQFMRCGIAFSMSGVVGGSIAGDCLYGVPTRSTSRVNLGCLKKGFVNIAIHGHSPILSTEIIKMARTKKFIKKAKDAGAEGIQFYGVCCSGLSSMYRMGGVIPLANANGVELVLATGALDLWVADVQDIFPSIIEVARCFKTVVVTTNESTHLPGAEHYGYKRDLSNLDQLAALADKILTRAVDSFKNRRDVPVYIPPYEVEAEVGFGLEYLSKHYGGSVKPVADALKEGKILGIINLAGCTNTRVIYEKAIVDIVDILLKNNILVLTNGCASFPMAKLGYCTVAAQEKCGESLKEFLGEDMPPVWHMGECIDNAHAVAVFGTVAGALGHPFKDLPYAEVTPEWSNEKGVGAALAFRMLGFNSYHCVHAPVQGSDKVMEFLSEGTKELLGSAMIVDVNPACLAQRIVEDFKDKRKALGWK
ncbi:MAG: anaerobic carbon-monoxide dehydrogenase catalytic subunit [Desulfovibrionaceae bacterium]|nr:anaerobic carbon-monoxide dehydrogenase catalytic subunit [Desulfovibrionaceae bacterium]MBF0514955.1 anaerobic carbon-monoxide dehydrogenase catalytic subunit [Desulfovibrionaceae bacterium]